MTLRASSDPIDVALSVIDVLDRLGIVATVGGSIASSFAGEPRSTVDIDIAAAIEESQVPAIVRALGDRFYADEEALRRAARDRSSANVIHRETAMKVDLFVAGGTPLDRQQLERRRHLALGDGRTLPVHPPEDILLQTLRGYDLGNRVSDRQWRDIRAIVRVQGSRLDVEYLRRLAPRLGVTDLLERALGE